MTLVRWSAVIAPDTWPGRRVLLAGSVAVLVVALIDAWLGSGPRALLPSAVADETAHLLTALVLLAAIPVPLPVRFIAGTLVGAVGIDLDHLPLILGSDLLTQQTNRPFMHCLLTIVIVMLLATLMPSRWRGVGVGIAAGIAAHFWRDLATSTAGVPLLWPWQTFGYRLPSGVYFGVLIGCVAIASLRRKRSGSR